jgi:hypothetical protein
MVLAADPIDPLAIAFEGFHFESPLFDQLRADESAHTVSLPSGRCHDRLESRPAGLPQ